MVLVQELARPLSLNLTTWTPQAGQFTYDFNVPIIAIISSSHHRYIFTSNETLPLVIIFKFGLEVSPS